MIPGRHELTHKAGARNVRQSFHQQNLCSVMKNG
jgi:hypothetical protein